ncbi:hypothetical protein CANARDRAFT_182438, partial [[Candida] arabinofermentans NRRL YB-2248]
LRSISELIDFDQIQIVIRKVFQDCQSSISTHKRQLVILKATQQRCRELNMSDQFNGLFLKLINKLLPIKRNEPVGDKIVRFVTAFVSAINPDVEDADENEANTLVSQEDEQMFTEFIDVLARHLVKGLNAANRNVRYRVCHLLSHLMQNMSSIDSGLYETISEELLSRIYDREPQVRMKAIATIASFQEPDGSDSISDAAKKIRFVMQNDSNPDVRRICLKLLEKNEFTKPYIFERARDVNTINRKILYHNILPEFGKIKSIDFNAREKLLTWGLRDREEVVRKAATKWLTQSLMEAVNDDVLKFLERLEVTKSEIAETALRVFLDDRPDVVSKIKFNDEIIRALTPETSMLFRIYFEYCTENKWSDQLDEYFPEAAKFSDVISYYFEKRRENLLKIEEHRAALQNNQDIADEIDISDPTEFDFVLKQLLTVAVDYDYSDEFGRSKMLNILRSTLTNDALTDEILAVMIKCIRKLSISERDFCSMIVDIINDLKDSAYEKQNPNEEAAAKTKDGQGEDEEDDDDDEDGDKDNTFRTAEENLSNATVNQSMQQELRQVEELAPEVLIDCLTIARRMLELTTEQLRDNISINSIVGNLIHPAIRRKEVKIRELGLICLGLCCTLDKDLAINSMFICGIYVSKSNVDSLIIIGLKVISDLLAVHGVSILESDKPDSVDSMAVAKLFYRTLRDNSRKEVQATSGEALYKLFLCGVINDDELFETTLLAYFNPAINDNESLKQCLAFCIPVYAFSHVSHQERIIRVVSDTLFRLFNSWEDMTDDNVSVASPHSIIQQLLYWTHPSRIVNRNPEEAETSTAIVDVAIQLLTVLERLDYTPTRKLFYKPIIVTLPKLEISEKVGLQPLQALYDVIESLELGNGGGFEHALKDIPSRNAFNKFKEIVEEAIAKASGDEE